MKRESHTESTENTEKNLFHSFYWSEGRCFFITRKTQKSRTAQKNKWGGHVVCDRPTIIVEPFQFFTLTSPALSCRS